jgi:hypothetical protein
MVKIYIQKWLTLLITDMGVDSHRCRSDRSDIIFLCLHVTPSFTRQIFTMLNLENRSATKKHKSLITYLRCYLQKTIVIRFDE